MSTIVVNATVSFRLGRTSLSCKRNFFQPLSYKRSLILQCGFYSNVPYTPVWLILQCGLYSSVAYTPEWLILQYGLYSSVAYTPVWLILQCGLYSSVAYTPVWLILQCGLYSSVAYTPVWLILQCGLYSSVAYTPVWLILQCGLYSRKYGTVTDTSHVQRIRLIHSLGKIPSLLWIDSEKKDTLEARKHLESYH